MHRYESFKVADLRLDERNYRIGEVANQPDAVRAIIKEQGDKLLNLAANILDLGGLSPGELIWVVPSSDQGRNVVVEGNRRITALKLL